MTEDRTPPPHGTTPHGITPDATAPHPTAPDPTAPDPTAPDPTRRERRSPSVMLLDALMRLAVAAQSGPQPKLRPAGRGRRGTVGWLVAGVLLAVAGTAVVVAVVVRGPGDLASLPPRAPDKARVAEPAPSTARPGSTTAAPTSAATTGVTSPSASSASTVPVPGSAVPPLPPGAATPSSAAAGSAPLAAQYRFPGGGTGLLGYDAEVTIFNPGAARRRGWVLTLTLPRPTLQIARVSGATARQDGSTWTFEPDDTTRSVPADGSVQVSFSVLGATLLDAAPQDCRIDGATCARPDDPPPA
ncbi:cellulose binding domain-containing protein [Nucisporomicrobium flavum]|uniref:cellulose binding domain-containing protein n=1 Tax=Nucisporomicrobium flavum TaxID=2785915 RepID=UPI0018F7502C|nr:cellulose binding domain-containing protein [Nucisporomicrobium flavum]